MKNLNLNLTIEEINLILEALGSQPYSKVFPLVSKIHLQASEQINTGDNSQKITGPGH